MLGCPGLAQPIPSKSLVDCTDLNHDVCLGAAFANLLLLLLVVLDLAAGRRIRHHNLLLGQVGHAILRPPPLLAQVIVGRVYRQPVQPRFKYLRRPQLVERKIQPQENFLCDVLDIFRTGDQTTDGPHRALPVRQDDFVKCRTITLLRTPDSREVYQHATPLAAAGPVLDFVSIGVKAYPQVTRSALGRACFSLPCLLRSPESR